MSVLWFFAAPRIDSKEMNLFTILMAEFGIIDDASNEVSMYKNQILSINELVWRW